MPDPAPAQLDATAASRLRRLNVIVGSVHALQAVVLLAIATAASLPITASFLIGPPGAGEYGAASLGSVRIDWLVAAFLLLAAVDHLTLSGGRPRRWYEANVARGINCAWTFTPSAESAIDPSSTLRSSTVMNTRSISDFAHTTSCDRLPQSSAARIERSALACATSASSAAVKRCWTSDGWLVGPTAAIIVQVGAPQRYCQRAHRWER